MRDKVKPRNIHVPVRYVAGVWECELGGPVPVVEGAVARLSISASDISGSAFLEAMNRPAKHRVLGEGATFRIALTIKPGTPLSPELHKHLISYRQIKHQIATEEFLDSFNSSHLYFVEVSLSKPNESHIKRFETADGGLWFITEGLTTTGIESTTVILPPAVSDERAISLNHSLTRLSETYETTRRSHTGNVYARVLYQAQDNRWYPLDVLRKRALEDQANAIGGQLWDEFMRKMQALRDTRKGQ
jgi:hypothetical protein